MLIAAMFLLFLLTLSLSIAAPLIARSIRRDRELETMERGKQYARAIQLYYRKFNAYPPSIDALVKTNNIRYLRKKYINPMTGKNDWKPIMFGQNKAPMAMGFFGEPLAGGATALAGTGPSGGNMQAGTRGIGSTAGGGLTGSGGLTNSIFGSGTSTTGAGTTGTTTTGTGQPGTTGATTGTSTGSSTGTTPGTGTGIFGSSGAQTFGGAGVVGVAPPTDKQSILIYKKKQKYSEWEFTYSPLADQMKQMGGNAGTVGQPASSLGRPLGSTTPTAPTTPTRP